MTETSLPQSKVTERDYEDIDKSHVAWLIRFIGGVLQSRKKEWYSVLQREYPGETLRMAFELRQIYRKVDPKDTKLAFICHTGNSSMGAAEYFRKQGFTSVHNVVGGIDAWSQEIDSSIPRY